jgi:hypothetical protein
MKGSISANEAAGAAKVKVPCSLTSPAARRSAPNTTRGCGRRFGDRRTLAIAAALEDHLQNILELARPLPDLTPLAA